MSDAPVATHVVTDNGEIDLQRYLIATDWTSPVKEIKFKGIATSWPTEEVLAAIREADGILFPPSNPFVSIGPILALKGVKGAIKKNRARKIGVSPLIGGLPVKGPLHHMMNGMGYPCSVAGIAEIYKDTLDALVIDPADSKWMGDVEKTGVRPLVEEILLDQPGRQKKLAQLVVKELQLS
jgi:LPPG:FO 2-phospho-L-lactate transferase